MDAETLQPPPGSSVLLPSPLQHQAQYLQAIDKTIQQFHQHLKTEQLDRMRLQIFVFQLQNEFALLRFLLFFSLGTFPISDTSVKNSANCPPINPKPNPNPNLTSNAFLLPCAVETSVRSSNLEDDVGPPRAKPNIAANDNFQSSTTTRDGPLTMVQDLLSTISKLKKLFTDGIATYTSITAGIYTHYFFHTIKITSLKLVIRILSFGRFLQ